VTWLRQLITGLSTWRLRFDVRLVNIWFMLLLIIKPTRCTNFSNLFFGIKLYMFQTVPLSIIRSFSLYTKQWYMSYRFAGSLQWANLYDIYHCCVYRQRNCPKHVEFYPKNKFEKLVSLVGFIIRICHDAQSPEHQIWFMVYKVALWQVYLLVLQFTSVSFIPPVLHTHSIIQPSITIVIKPQELTSSL